MSTQVALPDRAYIFLIYAYKVCHLSLNNCLTEKIWSLNFRMRSNLLDAHFIAQHRDGRRSTTNHLNYHSNMIYDICESLIETNQEFADYDTFKLELSLSKLPGLSFELVIC